MFVINVTNNLYGQLITGLSSHQLRTHNQNIPHSQSLEKMKMKQLTSVSPESNLSVNIKEYNLQPQLSTTSLKVLRK